MREHLARLRKKKGREDYLTQGGKKQGQSVVPKGDSLLHHVREGRGGDPETSAKRRSAFLKKNATMRERWDKDPGKGTLLSSLWEKKRGSILRGG